MKSPEEERYEALAAALARLAERQAEIERRLARLEAPEPSGEAAQPARPVEPCPQPARSDHFQPRELETRMGLTWINRLGVITLLLGAGFFFKYAVERRWIGETLRVLMGVGAGALGLALADRMWRHGHRVYAQGLCGGAIGILFLSFYAAHGLYHLVPQTAAFALMAATTAAAGCLAVRYASMAIALLGLLGGYLTPLLLNQAADHPWFLLGYVLLLDAGARFAALGRPWRGLEVLAFLATIWLYGSQFQVPAPEGRRLAESVFALAYYGVFASLETPVIVLPAQMLAALALAGIWSGSVGPYVWLSLLLLAAGLTIADQRGWPGAALASMAAFWMSYAAWYPAEPSLRPVAVVLPYISAGCLLLLAWAPWRTLGRRTALRAADLLVLALNAGCCFGAAYGVLLPSAKSYTALVALLLAGAYAAVAYRIWEADRRGALLACGVSWVLLMLAAPLQFSGYRVTMAWSLEALAAAWIGSRLRERKLVYAALSGFGVSLLRLLWIDSTMYLSAAQYGLLANGRFLTFGIVAGALWAAAYSIAGRWPALATYLAGHFVMLWGLGLETLGWAERVSAADTFRNVASTSVSILIGAYAVLLVAAGVAQQSAVNRIFGLCLIGTVVAKLYLYDVWLLGLFYRMAAFAGLGLLLLVMSYLYSHFRLPIEQWWQRGRK